jgi:hypothetical protein
MASTYLFQRLLTRSERFEGEDRARALLTECSRHGKYKFTNRGKALSMVLKDTSRPGDVAKYTGSMGVTTYLSRRTEKHAGNEVCTDTKMLVVVDVTNLMRNGEQSFAHEWTAYQLAATTAMKLNSLGVEYKVGHPAFSVGWTYGNKENTRALVGSIDNIFYDKLSGGLVVGEVKTRKINYQQFNNYASNVVYDEVRATNLLKQRFCKASHLRQLTIYALMLQMIVYRKNLKRATRRLSPLPIPRIEYLIIIGVCPNLRLAGTFKYAYDPYTALKGSSEYMSLWQELENAFTPYEEKQSVCASSSSKVLYLT